MIPRTWLRMEHLTLHGKIRDVQVQRDVRKSQESCVCFLVRAWLVLTAITTGRYRVRLHMTEEHRLTSETMTAGGISRADFLTLGSDDKRPHSEHISTRFHVLVSMRDLA